jgi:hypothetical protein
LARGSQSLRNDERTARTNKEKKMMKKTMLALAITLAATATHANAFGGRGGPGRPPSIEDLDADGDGALSAEEFAAPALEHFDEMDVDDDGVVSSDEFVLRAQERFEEIDADGNGVVTEEELQAAHPRRMRRG